MDTKEQSLMRRANNAWNNFLGAQDHMRVASKKGDIIEADKWKLRAADFLADLNAAEKELESL